MAYPIAALFVKTDSINYSNVITNIIFLLIIAVMFIICGIISYFKIGKPSSFLKRYMVLFLLPIYTIIIWTIWYFISSGGTDSSNALFLVLANPFFIVTHFIFDFSGFALTTFFTEISIYLFFLIGFIFGELVSKKTPKRPLLFLTRGLIVTMIVFFIAFVFKNVYNFEYQPLITDLTMGTVDVSDISMQNLSLYTPFANGNSAANLSTQASLQFKNFDEMPRLDGVGDTYPVYSAFAQAVYVGFKNYNNDENAFNDPNSYENFISNTSSPYNIIQCSGNDQAYTNLLSNKTDIIFTSETPTDAEKQVAEKLGEKFVLTPIAKDSLVFFVNKKNNISGLTSQQIQDIYSGSIKNWSQLGGSNSPILAYQIEEYQNDMNDMVMKNIKVIPPIMENYVTPDHEFAYMVVASYHNSLNALGYASMRFSYSEVKNNKIKYLSVNGVSPTDETVRNCSYPYTNTLYAISLSNNKNENVGIFLKWILGAEGQELIKKSGYVSLY